MWIDYDKATSQQQAAFRHTNPHIVSKFGFFRIWITRRGSVSRQKGQWSWTDKHAADLDAGLQRAQREAITGECEPAKDDGARFKTADFHLDRS